MSAPTEGGAGTWTATRWDGGAMTSDFQTSASTEKLDAALAKAQGEMKNAVKNRENPFFKSSYADLAAIWEACREALSKYGISVTQWPVHSDDESQHLVTRVGHDGEWMLARASVPVGKQDVQTYGSAQTYLRRYSLSALLGIATEDDDGQSATESGKAPKPAAKKGTKPEPKQEPEPIFGERQKFIMDLPATLGIDVKQAQAVWLDVVGSSVGVEAASPEQLDQFEAALRAKAEPEKGTDEPPF